MRSPAPFTLTRVWIDETGRPRAEFHWTLGAHHGQVTDLEEGEAVSLVHEIPIEHFVPNAPWGVEVRNGAGEVVYTARATLTPTGYGSYFFAYLTPSVDAPKASLYALTPVGHPIRLDDNATYRSTDVQREWVRTFVPRSVAERPPEEGWAKRSVDGFTYPATVVPAFPPVGTGYPNVKADAHFLAVAREVAELVTEACRWFHDRHHRFSGDPSAPRLSEDLVSAVIHGLQGQMDQEARNTRCLSTYRCQIHDKHVHPNWYALRELPRGYQRALVERIWAVWQREGIRVLERPTTAPAPPTVSGTDADDRWLGGDV